MGERFEREPRPGDPEWIISELRTLCARWGEVDTKRPLSKIDLNASESPHELAAPDEGELRQREVAVVQELVTAVESHMFSEEQELRIVEVLKEAEKSFDDERVIAQIVDIRHLIEHGPNNLP